MLKKHLINLPQALRAIINDNYRADERSVMMKLIENAQIEITQLVATREQAMKLVTLVRAERKQSTGIDSFLTEYSLSTDEGIALMCLAEALLRVPDNPTIDKLIKDKLTQADWQSHKGQSDSFFVNATTWALMLTGKVLAPEKAQSTVSSAILSLMSRGGGETAVRMAVDKAMRIMSKQFVMGRTIHEALVRAKKKQIHGYRYSYDMLGEAALTEVDAARYLKAYMNAIEEIGIEAQSIGNSLYEKPGISIKLSALHPRYQEAQREKVLEELTPKLLQLSQLAKKHNISLTIDAEESERLDLSLDVIEAVFTHPTLDNWNGFGMAVQSYQKRAFYLLDWIAAISRKQNKRMMVRLIKGAYWDSEIKKSQMQGLSDYPVFTRKVFTDVSFQACAKKILTMTDAIYPQFATHNAYSVAMILSIVGDYRDFEFQCLHGMGVELYEHIVPKNAHGIPCRIYAPVGTHEDLLPYLVRRLLENGANSSFVNRIVDDQEPIEELVFDPVVKATELLSKVNQNIPLPADIFMPLRKNSPGIDLSNRAVLAELQLQLTKIPACPWIATSLIAGGKLDSSSVVMQSSPQRNKEVIAKVTVATVKDLKRAIDNAQNAFTNWSRQSVVVRAAYVERFAELLIENTPTLLAMLCIEAGKTWNDSVGELREAVDFCYYYASMAAKLMEHPTKLQGYTGELNEWSLHPRGVLACISPWNFPLAIFVGQVIAALVTGNCVVAKPAEQTSAIAYYVVKLMYEAGIPVDVMQLVLGDGATIGSELIADLRIKGVIFTGSTQTAHIIAKQLATRSQEITPLIAETGGQNVMIVDSSALLEQVVLDVLASAFGSAGQRCSALRVIYVQAPVYPRFIELLKGAMSELRVGDPRWLETDLGPVIDKEALTNLQDHVAKMLKKHKLIYQCNLNSECQDGYFMPPTAIEIDSLSELTKEVFGPILHVLKFDRDKLDDVIQDVNNTGFGLTLGIHSRINATVEYIRQRIHVGNCYVNRTMTGAVVGLQPFGGEGLSGTGPKAGGPLYLQRLCVERTYTVDTTAAGGNASLMSLPDVE